MSAQIFTHLSVLLVDDENITRLVGKSLLESSGHEVVCCGSGEQALQALETSAFDVVLMDINMPGINGVEATKQIRERGRHPECKIFAVTASATPDELQAYRMAGLDAVLIKPLRRGKIESALAEISEQTDARPADEPPTRVVLDSARLEVLADSLPRAKTVELLKQAGQSIEVTVSALRAAWKREDRQAIAQWAHRLVGVTANFGCDALEHLARTIESDCKQGGGGRDQIPQFDDIYEATLEALKKEWESEP